MPFSLRLLPAAADEPLRRHLLVQLIHSLCASGRYEEAHLRVSLSLSSPTSLPDHRTVNLLLSRLLSATHLPHLTLRLFRQLMPSSVPSLPNFNRLLSNFCSLSQPDAAFHDVFSLLKTLEHSPDCVSYTILIDGFSSVGRTKAAQQLFVDMLKRGIWPNPLTCTALAKGFFRRRMVNEWRREIGQVWICMREGGIEGGESNHAAFADLVGALCREGLVQEVFAIAEEMPQGRCVDEDFAYGEMIDALCRSGRHHGASRIVYIMRRRGFRPSLVSYNCIVHNLSEEGEGGCMRAYQLFEEGLVFGYLPWEPTYKVLVEGLCRFRDVSKAKVVTDFMLNQQKGVADRTRIYNIFISALGLVDKPSEQLNVLISMLQNQCKPDVVTLNTVIFGFCKLNRVTEAMRILDDMLNGKFSSPEVITFTVILQGLLSVGKIEEALNVLHHKMPRYGCKPTIVTYNATFLGLCKLKKIDKAIDLFHQMVSRGITTEASTYAVLLSGLCDSGRVSEAKKFWEDVVWPSKVHDDYVYSAILKGLCNVGNLNEACDFLYELVDCGLSPGIVNYNIVIGSACKLGLKKEAYQIVGEMRKNGLSPDGVTWRMLNKLHVNERKDKMLQNSDSNVLPDEDVLPPKTVDRSEVAVEGEEKKSRNDITITRDDSLRECLHRCSVDEKEKILKSDSSESLSRIARRMFGLI